MSEEMSDREHRELLVLYETIIQDIRYTKTQIWNTTYLTVLAIGAIFVAVKQFLSPSPVGLLGLLLYPFLMVLSSFFIFFIGICGIRSIELHQESLLKYQGMKEVYREKFLIEQVLIKFQEEEQQNKSENKKINKVVVFFLILGRFVYDKFISVDQDFFRTIHSYIILCAVYFTMFLIYIDLFFYMIDYFG